MAMDSPTGVENAPVSPKPDANANIERKSVTIAEPTGKQQQSRASSPRRRRGVFRTKSLDHDGFQKEAARPGRGFHFPKFSPNKRKGIFRFRGGKDSDTEKSDEALEKLQITDISKGHHNGRRGHHTRQKQQQQQQQKSEPKLPPAPILREPKRGTGEAIEHVSPKKSEDEHQHHTTINPLARKDRFMVDSQRDLMEEYDKILRDTRDSVVVSGADLSALSSLQNLSLSSMNSADLPETVEEEDHDDSNADEDAKAIETFNKSAPAVSSGEFERDEPFISQDVFNSYDQILTDFRDSSRLSFTVAKTNEKNWEV